MVNFAIWASVGLASVCDGDDVPCDNTCTYRKLAIDPEIVLWNV